MSLPDHIESKIRRTNECWLWTGEVCRNGYGRAWYKGVRSAAHRVVYSLLVGGNIEGKQLDHVCCVRNCVNPEHLQPVTAKKNCRLRERRSRK
jgi:hypothetical protein